MSKVTHNLLPNFGKLDKSEEEKKMDTMFAWIGATSLDDFESYDRDAVRKAIQGYCKEAAEEPVQKEAHFIPGPFKLKSKNEPGEPEFEMWRKNHDYTGENYTEKVKRRLKSLQKELRKQKKNKEADEVGALAKSVMKKVPKPS